MDQPEYLKLSEIFTKTEIDSVNKSILNKLEKYLEHESILLISKQEEIELLKVDSQHCSKELEEKKKHCDEISIQLTDVKEKAEKSQEELSEQLRGCEKARNELESNFKAMQGSFTEAQARLVSLQAEKESFRKNLTRKQDELSSLTSQIKSLNEELLKFDKEKWQFRAREDELQLKESALQMKESQMQSMSVMMQKQIQNLQKEIDEKNVEILMRSKESSEELLRLKEKLAGTSDELRSKEGAVERSKETIEQQAKTIDELTERLRESVDFDNQVKSALRQELNAQKRIADLHQDGQRVAEEKLKQTTDGIRELQRALKDAVEKYGELETCFETSKQQHAEQTERLKEAVVKLEEELKHANDLLEKKGATVGDLSLLTPAGAEVVKSGITITQMYSEYATVSEKNSILQAENKHLKEYTEKIIREVDERIPMIRQQAFELQKEREENEELRQQIAHAQTLVSRCRYEAEVSKSDAQFQKRQNARMELQIKDLERQVTTLLKEIHQFKVGAAIADTPEDLGFDSDVPQAQRIISEKFVTFKDITELHENNQRLLATIRKLSEDSESAEAEAVADRTRELTAEVTKLESQLQELGDSRQRSEEMVERLRRQYDVQKTLADSLNSSIQQRVEGEASMVSVKEDRIRELTSEIREMRDRAEKERSSHQLALADQRREMQETVNKLNEQSVELKVSAEKLTSMLDVEQEKFIKLQSNAESSKKEISALLEKNSALTGKMQAQDQHIAALKQEILSLEQKLKRSEVSVSQLQMERHSLRDNIQQLTHEVTALRKNSTQNALASKLESLQSELSERNSSDSKRLKIDLERAHAECEIVRKDLTKHLSIYESSREDWRARESELKGEIEGAALREGQIRNELNTAEHKVEELKLQLSEVSEALKVQQRMTVPKSPHVSQPMNARFSTIQTELIEAKNQIEELNSEIERLQCQVAETENQRNQYRATAEAHERQIMEISQQMENSTKSLEKQLDDAKSEVASKKQEIDALRSSIHGLNHEIDRFELIKEEIRAERQREFEKVENDRKAASVTISFMNQRESDLQNELKGLKATVTEKDTLYRDELIAHARSVNQMKTLQEDLNELNTRIASAEKKAVDAVAKHRLTEEKAAVDVQALEARLDELRSSNSELRKINNVLQEQLANLTESTQADRDLNVSSSVDEERSNQQLLEVIAFLRRDSNLLRAQLDRAEAETSQLSVQVKQSQSQFTVAEAELQRERTLARRSFSSADHEELLRKVETMTSLQDSNRRLRDEITVLREEHEEARKKLEEANAAVEPLKLKNKKLSDDMDALNVEATVLRNEITRVKTQSTVFSRNVTERTRFQAEKDALEKTLKEKEVELARARDSLNTALRQMEVAQKNFNQSNAIAEQLNAKIEQLNAKFEQTDKAKSALEEELATLKTSFEVSSTELSTVKPEMERIAKELEKANGTVAQLRVLGRKYKRECEIINAKYEELEKAFSELKEAKPVMTIKEDIVKSEGEIREKTPEAPRRMTAADLFIEPSTSTEPQESGKVAELESAMTSMRESNELLQALSESTKMELQTLKKENDDLKEKSVKLQEELENQAKRDDQEKEKLKSNIADLANKNSSLLQRIDELNAEIDFLKARVGKLEKDLTDASVEKERLVTELQRTRDQKLSRTIPQEAPTANVRPMASPAPQTQTAPKGLAVHPTRSLPTAPPTASIRPMAMQPRAVGQATPIVTCPEITPLTTSVSTPQALVQPSQAEARPTTPVVAVVTPTPTPSAEIPTSASAGVNDGASTSRGKSVEPEMQIVESGVAQSNQPRIKRLREPDSTPDEAAKKRNREDLPQEPVTQTSESIQREAELRRTLLAARRTVTGAGGSLTVTLPTRASVVQPTSSAVEELIDLSSDSSVSEKDAVWDEMADEGGSYDEEHSGSEEEGSDEERSGDESTGELSNDNEATLGDESMEPVPDLEPPRPENLPESSHVEGSSRSVVETDEGVVPGTPVLVRSRGAEAFAEAVVSPQVPVSRAFFFDQSTTDAQNPALSRDIEATRVDLGQLEESARAGPSSERFEEDLESSVIIEEAFEDVAEVSTSGQEASAGDGGEQADSPVNGSDGNAVGPSSSRVTRASRAVSSPMAAARIQAGARGGRMLRRPQQGSNVGSQEHVSPSRGLGSGRARRSRGGFK